MEPRHAASAWPVRRDARGDGGGVCGGVGVRVAATEPPCSPEALEAAHARYAAALDAIAERHSACRCVLVVTHGACGMQPRYQRLDETICKFPWLACCGGCMRMREASWTRMSRARWCMRRGHAMDAKRHGTRTATCRALRA